MAEVLEFNDMFYTNFEPKMKNRFIMEIDGIPSYLIKTANRPSIQFETITLDHINVKRKIPIFFTTLENRSMRNKASTIEKAINF